ncbi:MAG TPA: hypothetical protein VIK18_08090 [Pirellulales bacterium]
MRRVFLPLGALALLASPLWAQAVAPQLGLGGQGMGGSAAYVNPFGNQLGNRGYGMMSGMGLNGSGFVPGGQNMGGQSLSMNQYMSMMLMRGLAGRNGSYGPRRGVANPFATPNYPGANGGGGGQQMSLKQPKTHSGTPKLTPEERKATIRRLAEERKAKAKEAAAQKKAKAAQKKAQAKQG